MKKNEKLLQKIFECLADAGRKPQLFEPGEQLFWNDPHISKSMLDAHLNPNTDGASRRAGSIEKTINHLVSTSVIKQDDKVIDLGCGPGLYSSRLCMHGINVTGIDISQRSINYAQKKAEELGLSIDYICRGFLDIDYDGVFDCVLQIYGELCTFSDEARNRLLGIIHRALKDEGRFIFDVSTRNLRMREGATNNWHFSDGGFWRPNRHVVLEQGFDYPEHDAWLNQYTVIAEDGEIKTYRLWFHDYSLSTISQVLNSNGFEMEYVWSALDGAEYKAGSDWIAVAAKKL
ncbi:class I SAM-dependent methyltransferase|uniref:Methyltransferase domain-containing protein n=1 Tax=Dendrosporobacter quercicolus TaxID=146817 RepID=A0A1G9NNV3_9FIRM|nr:class I SAM-dependent methyltransferase [Dendrosporobacter quercicolus]NSL47405.1 class I SAM-dependent methyltransferase [Dendrosporobacter quercicolus DSM 1736]SDL88268.1 Methyltransferase domain-containing protein [Dendrosporobacter quercicolus]